MTHPADSLLKRLKHSKILGPAAKLLLTLGALWLVFRDMDFQTLSSIAKEQERGRLLEVTALLLLQITLGALRWSLILNALSEAARVVLSKLEVIKLYYVSVFFNCCLPGTVGGDVVRVWLVRSDHVSLPVAINSVIIDRVMALVALGLLVLATLPMLGAMAGFDAWLVMPLAIAAVIGGLWLLKHIDRLLAPWKHFRLIHWLLYFTGCLKLLIKRPSAATGSLIYAVVAHLNFCLAGYVLAQSLSIEITLLQCVTLIPAVMLAMTLPISIGGWGVREAGLVGMLGLAGVPQAQALMLSVELGLIGVLISLPGGLLWLVRRRRGVLEKIA